LKNKKRVSIMLGICLLIGIVGCGCSKPDENELVVSEPYSILLYLEKMHSGERLEKRIFEADTKGQFDRLVKKYKIHYKQKDCIHEFNKEFFKNNKVYIIHRNFLDNIADSRYKIERNNDIIEIVIYESFYQIAPFESKINSNGDLIVVSKEFAKDVKEVTIEYKGYNEYDEE